MPMYSYVCMHCGNETEERLTYEDRLKPLKEKCSNCGTSGQIIQKFKINASVDSFAKPKIDSGMRDTLRAIKKANKGSTIEVD